MDKKSSYEKLKEIFPSTICCGELDGKYSETVGEIEIQDEWETDEDYAKAGIASCDGNYLEYSLRNLYENNNLNWNAEQKEIREYFDGLDTWIEITVNIPASKRDELIKFAESLKNK